MSQTKLKLSETGCTNGLHSDAECKVIRAALRRAEEALLCLPASAVTLGKDLTDEIKRYKTALSPHKKLPADVWLHIFLQLCCHPTTFTGNGTNLSPLVVLSQVCSGWRQLLMASPAIWSNICVNLNNNSYALSQARGFLSRAGNIPRSLKIVRNRSYYRTHLTLHDTLFHPLPLAFSPLYRTSLESFQVEELVSLFPFRSLDIPIPIQFSKIPIESLLPLEELICMNKQGHESISLFPHSLPNLTCLKSVQMPRFHHPGPFATWPNLRKLVLRCRLPKSECLTILRDTTSIEECSMLVDPDGETKSTFEGIVLPRLTTLELDFRSDHDLVSFLDTLTLLNLTSLELGDGGCDESTLHRLAKRSGIQKMEKLVIFEAEKPLHIGVLLEIFPSLCHLGIHARITLDKSTMHRIGSGELGPRLRVLHLRGCQQLPSLLAITELRRITIRRQQLHQPKPISLLEKVSVEAYPHPLRESEERRIRHLSHDGIEFEVQICHDNECRHAKRQ